MICSTPRKESKLKQAAKAAKAALTDAHLDHKLRNKKTKQVTSALSPAVAAN